MDKEKTKKKTSDLLNLKDRREHKDKLAKNKESIVLNAMDAVNGQLGITNNKKGEAREVVYKYFPDEGVPSTNENNFNMVNFVPANHVPDNAKLCTVAY